MYSPLVTWATTYFFIYINTYVLAVDDQEPMANISGKA